MVEHCQTTCKDKGGAIFCDDQYVNAGNADSCASELNAKVHIDIDIAGTLKAAAAKTAKTASVVGDCVGSSCTVANVGAASERGWLGAVCALAGLTLWRMTRRRTRR
jgi:hypothetical protein